MFDAYQQWLGIPPGPRPPTHYDLLGVSPDESDPAEIEEAAQRRTNTLRFYQTGNYAVEAQRLLQEIAQARRVLSDPEQRRIYDAQFDVHADPLSAPKSHIDTPTPLSIPGMPAMLTVPDPSSSPQLCAPVPRLAAPGAMANSGGVSGDPMSRLRERYRPSWRVYALVIFLPTVAIAIAALARSGGAVDKESSQAGATQPKPTKLPSATKAAAPEKLKTTYIPLDLEAAANVASTDLQFKNGEPLRLSLLKWGKQSFCGIPFDVIDPKGGSVKNWIAVRGAVPDVTGAQPLHPRVPCSASASAIHILGGVSAGGFPATNEHTVSLVVRVHYVDGPDEDHKLLNGVHLADIRGQSDVPQSRLAAKIGTAQLRYLAVTPAQTGKMISYIELVKGNDGTIPVIAAITVERTGR